MVILVLWYLYILEALLTNNTQSMFSPEHALLACCLWAKSGIYEGIGLLLILFTFEDRTEWRCHNKNDSRNHSYLHNTCSKSPRSARETMSRFHQLKWVKTARTWICQRGEISLKPLFPLVCSTVACSPHQMVQCLWQTCSLLSSPCITAVVPSEEHGRSFCWPTSPWRKPNKSNLNSLERDYSKPNIAATSMPACSSVRPGIPCLEVKLDRPCHWCGLSTGREWGWCQLCAAGPWPASHFCCLVQPLSTLSPCLFFMGLLTDRSAFTIKKERCSH